MPPHNAVTVGFSHRPLGTRAVRVATPEGNPHTYEAVLRLNDASVHVRAVQEEADGSFSGTIFSIDPGDASIEGHVAVGDRVSFRGSQVFTFTGFRDETERPAQPQTAAGHAPSAEGLDHLVLPASPRPYRRRMVLAVCGAALLATGTALGYFLGTARESPYTPSNFPDTAWRLKIDPDLRSSEKPVQ